MSMFPAITVAGTGLDVASTWIDTIGGNVANAADTAAPGKPVYREQQVVAVPASQAAGPFNTDPALGVQVQAIALGSAKGVTVYDPTNPLANAQGLVTQPDIPIGHELVSLVEAQANYEADANVLQNADTAYKAVLQIRS